ncbi:hypothetical protein OC835_007808 [Tilletia horrida]|nr:hypothetical protein OC835_007808 [Tilletia horrida]
MDCDSALNSTSRAAAFTPVRGATEVSISAPFVAALRMAREAAIADGRALSPDGFEVLLGQHDLLKSYPNVVHGIKHGFDFGIPPIRQTLINKNHIKEGDEVAVIEEYIGREIEVGRSLGPFEELEVRTRVGSF